MPDMKEAFRKAARENPKSPIARVVRGVGRTQYEERHADKRKRELEKLGGRFEYVGRAWLNDKMGKPLSVGALKEEWKELAPLLANIEKSKRPELISRLAKGLMLSENLSRSYRVLAARAILKNPMGLLQEMFDERTFSPATKIFFAVVGDISGHTQQENTSFIEFMSSNENLPHGLVTLPQAIPAVAEWLVQESKSRANTQSSRLS